jgi:uncharacterized repeat protein (TIGR01451 family)
MDTLGNWIWKKTYGGSGTDEAVNIISDSDNGYILLARTNSNDGDVHGNHDSIYNGYEPSPDIWLFRLDSVGNILWQKCYGGLRSESAFRIIAADTGFVIIGNTNSTNGDVTERTDTSSNTQYSSDIWLLKIDANGIIQWDKCYGSSGTDQGYDVKIGADNSYYILGSMSGNDFDGTGNHGQDDAWFAKIDNSGNLIWSKLLGGSLFEKLYTFTSDKENNFILVGVTKSNDGDVSGNHGGADSDDMWMVKLNSSGNIIWQKCFGGSDMDDDYYETLVDVVVDKKGDYIAGGLAHSSDGDISFSHGAADAWIANVSKDGVLLWEKSLGGSSDEAILGIKITESEILFSGFTSSNDQDVLGNHGNVDIWLVKLGLVNTITGYAYYDLNANSIKDNNESLFSNGKIIVKSATDSIVGITSNGNFKMDVDTGTFNSSFVPTSAYHNAVPATHTSTFSTYNLIDTIYYAMQPISGKKDVQAFAFPINVARPGFDVSYKITYENVGTTDFANGFIQLIKDARLAVNSSQPNYASISGDTIKWNYTNLKASDTGSIILNFTLATPPVANNGDTLRSYLSMDIDGDLTPENNRDTVSQLVTGSFDPNDKTENHAGSISKSNVTKGDWLTYTIRFQNTGTDTAFNIIVRDTLDSKLDWNSLEMIDASHNYQLNINNGNTCAWYFNNVLLPDSNINEEASHGYIVYRIKPKTTLVAGDVINNTASIYFDYNLPVQTNTEKTVVASDVVMPLQLLSFSASRNGKNNLLKWSTAQEINTDRFEIQRSTNSRDFATIGTIRSLNNGKNKNDYAYTDAQPLKAVNYYRLKMVDKDGKFSYSTIRNVNNSSSFDVTLYPNPVHQNLTLSFNTEKAMDVQVEIVNAEGKKVYTKKMQLPYGASLQSINVAALKAGNYFVKCITADGQTGLKFVKQ